MTLKTFNLPDVGEGLTEAEIVQWRVVPGAAVSVNDIICEIETAKSLVELSSPYEGTVSELLVPEGETIEVGTPIISVEDGTGPSGGGGSGDSAVTAPTSGAAPRLEGSNGRDAQVPAEESAGSEAGSATEGQVPVPEMPGELAGPQADGPATVTGGHSAAGGDAASGAGPAARRGETAPGSGPADPVPGPLVGTGPKADAVKRRPRKAPSAPARAVSAAPAAGHRDRSDDRAAGSLQPPVDGQSTVTVAPAPPASVGPGTADRQQVPSATPAPSASISAQSRVNPLNQLINRVLAKPPVRKAARDLGINLADVPATGSAGEVTKQDLMSYQSQRDAEQDGADSFWSERKLLGGDRIERIPVKGVRKATARAMVQSAFTAPHVSIFVDVDASRTMEFVKRLKASRDFEGIRVSPLLILAKAVIWAAARNPSVNATWSDDEILVKHFMNLGIAAATPRGLMVPNIKDAQDLSLKELALALNELATTARAGKTQPAQMQGGTLTITNIGALGIDTGTPIINPGEVAIVAFGTIKQKPWVLDGEVIPRWITTLGGSFDHRVVDGDLSARFMADVASILEEPALLLD